MGFNGEVRSGNGDDVGISSRRRCGGNWTEARAFLEMETSNSFKLLSNAPNMEFLTPFTPAQRNRCARRLLYFRVLRLQSHQSRPSTTAASPRPASIPNAPPPAHPPTRASPNTPPTSSAPPATLTLSVPNLNLYNTTLPPTAPQLAYASRFFAASAPTFLFSATKFRSFPPSPVPEVAFLGRSNVGKSSLLNALLNRSTNKLAHVSSKPGRTRAMNAFGVGVDRGVRRGKRNAEGGWGGKDGEELRWIGGRGVVVVDMPGYGKGSRMEWGTEILKYLTKRVQLKRAFLLIDAEHGVKSADEQLLGILRENGVPHQIILSKVDKIVYPGSKPPSAEKTAAYLQQLRAVCEETRQKIQPKGHRGPVALGDILTCSAEKSIEPPKKLGIDGVRWAVLQAVGLECDEHGRKRVAEIDVLEDAGGEQRDAVVDLPMLEYEASPSSRSTTEPLSDKATAARRGRKPAP